jgi:hypothetical protein
MLSNAYQKLAICFLAAFAVLCTQFGCRSKDTCRDRPCVHGACVDAACLCEPTYEGTNCDTLCSAKFLGSLWYNRILCPSASSFLNARVTQNPLVTGGLILHNVYQQGDSIYGVAHQDSLIVAPQIYGVDYFRGIGLFGNGSFTLEFIITTTTGQETPCVAIFDR